MESTIVKTKPERCQICGSVQIEPLNRDRINKRLNMNCRSCGVRYEVIEWRDN